MEEKADPYLNPYRAKWLRSIFVENFCSTETCESDPGRRDSQRN
jgi:hypothetical protein